MPSPFRGMNPFLEQNHVWQDFHDSFVPALRDAIMPQVRPQFVAKIGEHLYIHAAAILNPPGASTAGGAA